MARIERVSAQGQIPVKQAQLIGQDAFRLSTAPAEALGEIGEVITTIGQRKRDMQDRLGMSNVNAIMENAQREMAIELESTPFDQKGEVRQKHINEARSRISQERLSPDAQQLAQNKSQIWADGVSDLGQLADVQELKQATDAAVIADYENALVNGSVEDIAESENAFKEQFATEPDEVFDAARVKVEARAEKAIKENAIAEQRNLSSINPSGRAKAIQAELESRQAGNEPTFGWGNISDSELRSLQSYTNTMIEDNKAKIDTQYKLATGSAATDFSEKMNNKTLTPEDVWSTVIEVDPSKEADVAAFKDKWAGIATGAVDRRATIAAGKKKAEREAAYDPAYVGDIKNRARAAQSETDVQAIQEEAAIALNDNRIDDGDMEAITTSSRQRFDSAQDKIIDSMEQDISEIILAGKSTDSLTGWLQGQALSAKLSGETFNSGDALRAFADTRKAAQNAINQSRSQLEVWIKEHPDKTLDDQRKQALVIQRAWLNKSDIELVADYKQWLSNKP